MMLVIISLCHTSNAQVKTKIFRDGDMEKFFPDFKAVLNEMILEPPEEFKELARKSPVNLDNKFSISGFLEEYGCPIISMSVFNGALTDSNRMKISNKKRNLIIQSYSKQTAI